MKSDKKIKLMVLKLSQAVRSIRQSFIVENFVGIEQILNIFYQDGWISGYKCYNKKFYEIFLKNDANNKLVMRRAKIITKASLQAIIRLPELLVDSKNTSCTGIIKTAKYGFLKNKHAFIKKTGGVYFTKIF